MINYNDYILDDNGNKTNFKYIEFIKSNVAARAGLNNIPNEEQ
jgi:hypothetical protein